MTESPIKIFLDAMYQAASTITGFFGVTPLQVLGIVGGLVLLSLVYTAFQAARGKTKFSLERDES